MHEQSTNYSTRITLPLYHFHELTKIDLHSNLQAHKTMQQHPNSPPWETQKFVPKIFLTTNQNSAQLHTMKQWHVLEIKWPIPYQHNPAAISLPRSKQLDTHSNTHSTKKTNNTTPIPHHENQKFVGKIVLTTNQNSVQFHAMKRRHVLAIRSPIPYQDNPAAISLPRE